MAVSYLIASLLGASVGSFFGVVVERGAKTKGKYSAFIGGRSRCAHCGHSLAWWENIPLLSFLHLRGLCSVCHSPFPYWLPLIELGGAFMGIWSTREILIFISSSTISIPQLILFVLALTLISFAFIWIFFSDLVYGVVPDAAVLLGSVGATLWNLNAGIWNLVVATVVAALFFWVLTVLTRGKGMGTGDVTLSLFIGLFLGWPQIITGVWVSFLAGALVALALLFLGKKRFGDTIPFGPILICSAFAVKLSGFNLLSWVGL